MALSPEDGKRMYENIDWILGAIDSADNAEGSAFVEMLFAITGLELGTGRHGVKLTVLDPSTRDDANRVIVRWLRDNGHLPPRGKVVTR